MIDIHSHIIPEVDDGSRNIQESISMIKKANEKGIKTIVATPHYKTNKYEIKRKELENKVFSLNNILKINNIDTKILLGQEIMVDINMFELFDKGIISGINNSKYILIEFDMEVELLNSDMFIKKIIDKGYIPIVAHPERYRYVTKDINIVKRWINSGALMQMNISSVLGNYGQIVQKTIIKLLNKNLIHLWGSDVHFFRDTYEDLEESLKILKRIIKDKKVYNDIIINNNFKVISNDHIKVIK